MGSYLSTTMEDNNVICVMLTCKSLYIGRREKFAKICRDYNTKNLKENTIKTDHHNTSLGHRSLPTLLRLFKDVRSRPDPTKYANQQMTAFEDIYKASLSQSSRRRKNKLVIKRQNVSSVKISGHIEKIKISKSTGVIDKCLFPSTVVQMDIKITHGKSVVNPSIMSWPSTMTRLTIRGPIQSMIDILPLTLLHLELQETPQHVDLTHLTSLVSLVVAQIRNKPADSVTSLKVGTKIRTLPSTLAEMELNYRMALASSRVVTGSVKKLIVILGPSDELKAGDIPHGVKTLILCRFGTSPNTPELTRQVIPDSVIDLEVQGYQKPLPYNVELPKNLQRFCWSWYMKMPLTTAYHRHSRRLMRCTILPAPPVTYLPTSLTSLSLRTVLKFDWMISSIAQMPVSN
ncbi:hypothetical protein DFA_03457 [Cavenderia fasciculata]|uniref:Uncharacterized protein n=1 Tax=Cavenderia fasciculata TaxID=261658 RepID=F4PHM5_CACFS|nr:uncharacterized protein DFA_03457 [Cavenderia fasciculata]EGG25209.1 hypothetical protein DFA_03457 [Cavenderia fasciculata]|eukprot:XP_004363060.1 hypothetical protein DFA_03457 [Cavenderia fasciculata]